MKTHEEILKDFHVEFGSEIQRFLYLPNKNVIHEEIRATLRQIIDRRFSELPEFNPGDVRFRVEASRQDAGGAEVIPENIFTGIIFNSGELDELALGRAVYVDKNGIEWEQIEDEQGKIRVVMTYPALWIGFGKLLEQDAEGGKQDADS